jgi:hypothetical protein
MRRGALYASVAAISLVLAGMYAAACAFQGHANVALPDVQGSTAETLTGAAGQLEGAPAADTDMLALAQRDPGAFVEHAFARYQREVHCYRATFRKKELLADKLTPVQEIEVRFREQPRTMYMLWRANADSAKRALFIDDPQYVDAEGHKLARVEPNGLARLVVDNIMMPIDGEDARKASRHPIDRAGFRAFFELFARYDTQARAAGVLDLKCTGTGKVEGRPTIVIERQLPYTGPGGTWPDARLVMHFDTETLLPIAVYSYADRGEKQLLGCYIYTDVVLNPAFTDGDFQF